MLKKPNLIWLLLAGSLFLWPVCSQAQYKDTDALADRVQELRSNYPDRLDASILTESSQRNPIWLLKIGSGEVDSKPAIAVFGGVAGHHLLGQELALGLAERLLQTDSLQDVLRTTTFYVFPQVSPDAAQQYFAQLRYERQANARNTDTDRDGYTNEDPGEDLNGDGMLTMMRVAAPDGDYVLHPADERVLRRAQPEDGTSNRYHLLPEGRDNDKDGAHSEDGPGGIHFNKNWTFKHPTFSPGAGEFAISEQQNRRIADFLYEHFNVFAVLTFGPSENLVAPFTYSPAHDRQRVISGILRGDAEVNKMVSALFAEAVRSKEGVKASSSDGGFMEWAYFHYGRYSYGTPGWYVPKFEMPKDSSEAAQYRKNEDNNADIDFLRWAASEQVPDVYVEWTEVEHPDFPNQQVEVGGIAPFVQLNPPYQMVEDLVDQHTDFAVTLSQQRAELALTNVRTEQVDDGLYRVKATLVNSGNMPSSTEIGERFNWIKRLRVDLTMQDNQTLSTGRPVYLYNRMLPGESKMLSWLIRGEGEVTLSAGAPHLGTDSITLELD